MFIYIYILPSPLFWKMFFPFFLESSLGLIIILVFSNLFPEPSRSMCYTKLYILSVCHNNRVMIDREIDVYLNEGRKVSHNNFCLILSSEPPQNPRPSNIIFFKGLILQDKTIF